MRCVASQLTVCSTAPVEVFNVKPAGNVPTTENVNGAVPPETDMAGLLKATPTSPVLAPTPGQVRLGAAMMVNGQLVVFNTAYALTYALAVIAGATLIFERRSLK